MLLFSIGPGRYAISVREVVEIVPYVSARPIPGAPPEVLGLVNYRGEAVPTIDLHFQLLGSPCRAHMSSRIIILQVQDHLGAPMRIGALAEDVTETEYMDLQDFSHFNLDLPSCLHLGPVKVEQGFQLQLVSPQNILTDKMKRMFRVAIEQ